MPLPVLFTLVSPAWSLLTLTGRRILPEDTAVHLPVREDLGENHFRPVFHWFSVKVMLRFPNHLYFVSASVYLYLIIQIVNFFICDFCPCLQSLNHNSEIQKIWRTVVVVMTLSHLMTKPDLRLICRY